MYQDPLSRYASFTLCFFCAMLICSLPSGASARPKETIAIPDAGLEAALRNALGIPTDPLLDSDLASLLELDASSREISGLTGIEFCTSLKRLNLNDNQITNLTPLSAIVSLETLELDNNQISDLPPLSGLTGLGTLHLASNDISDVSALAPLTALTGLVLNDNSIDDLTALTGMSMLAGLEVKSNLVSSITPLSSLTAIEWLYLDDNQIEDISALSGLAALYSLGLPSNSIADLSPLSGLVNLRDLILTSNPISDLTALVNNPDIGPSDYIDLRDIIFSQQVLCSQVTVLQSRVPYSLLIDYECGTVVTFADQNLEAAIRAALNIPSGDIYDTDMAALTTLDASSQGISDLTGLEFATHLTDLNLGENQISDIAPLSGLTVLTALTLQNNQISDLGPLSGLEDLVYIYLAINFVSDASPLAYLTNLQFLDLGTNSVHDLSALSGLTNLATVSLIGNGLGDSDLPALAALNPSQLYLDANLITSVATLSGMTNLAELTLASNQICDPSALLDNVGLGAGDTVTLDGNPLSSEACSVTVPALEARSITVDTGAACDGGGQANCESSEGEGAIEGEGNSEGEGTVDGEGAADGEGVDDGVVVVFADASFEAIVRTALGIPTGDIFSSDMATLQSIVDYRDNITSLSGIEYATNLTALSISRLFGQNQITDLTPLSGLSKLTTLELEGNQLTDIGPLSGLSGLVNLDLSGNKISDLAPIAGLSNLILLDVSNNRICDSSPLLDNSGLGLGDDVNLSGNPLSSDTCSLAVPALQARSVNVNIGIECDGGGLPNCSFTIVEIPDPNLEALIRSELNKPIGPLFDTDLATITELSLTPEPLGQSIRDLSGLEYCVNLTSFRIGGNFTCNCGNDIADLTPLSNLHNLTTLDLAYSGITSVSPLAGASQLEYLTLNNNPLSNLNGLENLTNLKKLDLNQTLSPDLETLSGLTQLEWLEVGSCGIEDISPLASMTGLKHLILGSVFNSFNSNTISDISPLTTLVGLEFLWLDYNLIENVSALRGLINLTSLNLEGNSICDITPLVANPGLGSGDEITLFGNPLNPYACAEQIPLLEARVGSIYDNCYLPGDFCAAWQQATTVYAAPKSFIPNPTLENETVGSIGLPFQSVQLALDFAGSYATAELPVTVRLGQGTYNETLVFPPHVRLEGPSADDPGEAVLQPREEQLQASNSIGVVLAEDSGLGNLSIQFDPDVISSGATLVLVQDVVAKMDNVILNGLSRVSCTGIQVLNPGSSGSRITRCSFRRLAFGVRAIDTAVNISRNVFESIESDAVVVYQGTRKTGENLTPTLGNEATASTTGYNVFKSVANRFINNLSPVQTVAEVNDWGIYESTDIANKMSGDTDFEPFLGKSVISGLPSVFIGVASEDDLPLYDATVTIEPGIISVSDNVDGIYVIPFVTPGSYQLTATAPYYLAATKQLIVTESSPAVIPATLILQSDGTAIHRELPEEHNTDSNGNGKVDLTELLRMIQLYNAAFVRCLTGTEDDYAPGNGDKTCPPHVADYHPTDWKFSLSELLRMIQFFNNSGYHRCDESEDGYCPGAD